VKLTEIRCVEKDGNFVVGIRGIAEQDYSTGSREEIRLLASDPIRGPIDWAHPQHGNLLIKKLRIMNIPCWYCEDPTKPDYNILENFPECN
jgi:hypothetical protein